MGDKSKIEWTDATWSPVTGCTKVSPGCAHCYAEAVTLRFKTGGPYLPGKATIKMHPDRLAVPIRWKRPRRVFVCSMSDLFHEEVPDAFIERVFDVMRVAPQHTFQVLTKRPERMANWRYLEWSRQQLGFSGDHAMPPNVWLGTSVENQHWADLRVPELLSVEASVRFLSVEPLLKAVDLRPFLAGLQWVIVGGESGPRARPILADWVRRIRDDCVDAGVPFFFKQWGGKTSKAGGREIDGRTWSEMPDAAAFLV